MTPRTQIETQRKAHRLFYDKTTGEIMGLASGGGALEELEGDTLIMATFNDLEAPTRIGMIETYYAPLKSGKPRRVNLGTVRRCQDSVVALKAARGSGIKTDIDAALEELLNARDAVVTHDAIPFNGPPGPPGTP